MHVYDLPYTSNLKSNLFRLHGSAFKWIFHFVFSSSTSLSNIISNVVLIAEKFDWNSI